MHWTVFYRKNGIYILANKRINVVLHVCNQMHFHSGSKKCQKYLLSCNCQLLNKKMLECCSTLSTLATSTPVTITVPAEYGYCVLVAVGSAFVLLWKGIQVSEIQACQYRLRYDKSRLNHLAVLLSHTPNSATCSNLGYSCSLFI